MVVDLTGRAGFASAVDGVVVREERWELLREAKWSLQQWELHRRDDDRQQLIDALEGLTRLMRGAR